MCAGRVKASGDIEFHLKDGRVISFSVGQSAKILIEDSWLEICTKEDVYYIPYEVFSWFSIQGNSSGVNRSHQFVDVYSDRILIKGSTEYSNIRLYNIEGKCFPINIHQKGEYSSVPISNIENGTYILVVGNNRFKFTKK